jgi:hypothetical protein
LFVSPDPIPLFIVHVPEASSAVILVVGIIVLAMLHGRATAKGALSSLLSDKADKTKERPF